MVDGRTRVLFDNGKEHRYKPSSVHKLTLADPRAKLRALQRVALSAGALVHGSMSKVHGSMSNMLADLGDLSDPSTSPKSTSPKATPPKSTSPKSRSGCSRSASASGRLDREAVDIERGKSLPGERSPSRARPQSQGVVDTRPVTFSRFPAHMKLVVVHAINDAEDGCEFEHFFTTAPPDLVQAAVGRAPYFLPSVM